MRRALCSTPWRNAERHRIHRRSQARAAPRTVGLVSDVHATPSLRSPIAIDRACPSRAQSSEAVAPLARSEIRSLPIELPSVRLSVTPSAHGRSPRSACPVQKTLGESLQSSPRSAFQSRLPCSWKPVWTLSPGVPIGCRSPQNGVLIPCRFTPRVPGGRFGVLLIDLVAVTQRYSKGRKDGPVDCVKKFLNLFLATSFVGIDSKKGHSMFLLLESWHVGSKD